LVIGFVSRQQSNVVVLKFPYPYRDMRESAVKPLSPGAGSTAKFINDDKHLTVLTVKASG
jgi:hypothetical protein